MTHWTEEDGPEITIGIQGEPGSWIVSLRRDGVCYASSANSSLVVAMEDALTTSQRLIESQSRYHGYDRRALVPDPQDV